MDWMSDAWDEYWNPPTPEQLVRRARVRVRRKVDDIGKRIEAEESREALCMKKLTKLAVSGAPREKLETVAHSIAQSRTMLKKLRGIHSSMGSLAAHVEAVDSSVTVREVLQVAADAIATVGVGSAQSVAEDSRTIYTQLAQLQALEEAAADVVGDDEETTLVDDLVNDIIIQAAASTELDLPSVPRSGPSAGMTTKSDLTVQLGTR